MVLTGYNGGVTSDQDFETLDATKAAGRIPPGEQHSVEFDTELLDVDILGNRVNAYVDGSESNLGYSPQPGGEDDSWHDSMTFDGNGNGDSDTPNSQIGSVGMLAVGVGAAAMVHKQADNS